MASYDNKVLTGDQLVYFSSLVKSALANKADASAVSGKQDALEFNTAYNASSNKVATMADIPTSAPINFEDGYWSEDNGTYSLDMLAIQSYCQGNSEITTDLIYTTETDETTGDSILLNDKLAQIDTAVSGKQDSLVFNTAYNASSNKVATMSDITTALSGISSFSFEIVQSLPQSDISTSKIYLVAKGTAGTNQVYTEYAYVNNAWEIIGDTAMTIDTLSNAEVATIWNTATASAS